MGKNRAKKKPPKDDGTAEVSLRGGSRARARRETSLLVTLRSGGSITPEQEAFGQKYYDDWALVRFGGGSSEMGIFVDQSGKGQSVPAARIDAAAALRTIEERLSWNQFQALHQCVCLGLSMKEVAAKSRMNPVAVMTLLQTALDVVVHCYVGRMPRPSRRIVEAEEMFAQAVAGRD